MFGLDRELQGQTWQYLFSPAVRARLAGFSRLASLAFEATASSSSICLEETSSSCGVKFGRGQRRIADQSSNIENCQTKKAGLPDYISCNKQHLQASAGFVSGLSAEALLKAGTDIQQFSFGTSRGGHQRFEVRCLADDRQETHRMAH